MKRLLILLIIFISIAPSGTNAQSALTIGEIFDFNVGDEFHHLIGGPEDSIIKNLQRVEIVDKFYSANNDTLFYVQHNFGYIQTNTSNGIFFEFENFIDTAAYTNLNNIIDPFCPYQFQPLSANMGPFYFQINQDTIRQDYDGVLAYQCSMYNAPTFNSADYWSESWGVGIGIIFSGYFPLMNTSSFYSYQLVYYKKGLNLFGIPDTLDSTDIGVQELYPSTASLISVYPNPSSDFINFDWKENSYFDIRVISSDGRLVMDRRRMYRGQNLNISELPSGSYIMQFNGVNGTSQSLFLKQ